MNLSVGGMLKVGTDQHGRLGHTDKRGGTSSNNLHSGNLKDVDNDPSHGTNGSLDDVVVVQNLDHSSEEDDGRQDSDQESGTIVSHELVADNETDTVRRESQEASHGLSKIREDGLTDISADDEESQQELKANTSGNSWPVDEFAVARCGVEDKEEEEQTAERDDTLNTGAVLVVFTDDGGQDDGHGEDAVSNHLANTERKTVDDIGTLCPDSMCRFGESAIRSVGSNEVEGCEAIGDGEDRDRVALVQYDSDDEEGCREEGEEGEGRERGGRI